MSAVPPLLGGKRALSFGPLGQLWTRNGRRSRRNPHRGFIEQTKLRRRHFDLCWLRRLLSGSCCRVVRSTTGSYDRHSSSSVYGMEVAADQEYVPR
jgi:hypothetical protein